MRKNVFITGVSSGVGLALARSYIEEDWEVYGISRREPSELKRASNFHFKRLDLREFDAIKPALTEMLEGKPALELVILNAGILGKISDLAESTLEEMGQVMDVNLWANKVIIDALFSLNIKVGQVTAISSGSAAEAQRGWNAYAISKAALNMLIGLYAAERTETHFSALAPGIIDTPMQEQISTMPVDERYPSLDFLREARAGALMPSPEEAAVDIRTAIEASAQEPSGSFVDLRTLLNKEW